mmetsp:Transcript_20456/g.48616  ORF Transcript_20456/g.48616 Transcript_20456/m.48616 type:complete len:464 (-) Transcript_20456:14-1405(-)
MSQANNNGPKQLAKMRSSSFSDSVDRYKNGNNNTAVECDEHNRTVATTATVVVSREVTIPDRPKIDRCHRLPEYGPVILFFSGGTAIRDLSSVLKDYTYNSIHLVTPFDSGGSSAEIRRAFGMLSVGDLRNRLVALSDPNDLTMRNNPDIPPLLAHRLASDGSERSELESIVKGRHVLMTSVNMPMRSILQSHLRWFCNRMPADFDLRGASVGNLVITGCFLEHERDIVTAIFLVSKLLAAKGICRPLTAANLHIRTYYDDGTEEVGQHRMNQTKNLEPGSGRIHYRKILRIDLVEDLQDDSPDGTRQESQSCHIDTVSSNLVSSADLIVFPMGSFFASLIVNLLPTGVGRSIVSRRCPKVYIPNTGFDPEMHGYSLLECVQLIIDKVRQDHPDGGEDIPVGNILNFILLDTVRCVYTLPIEKDRIEALGISVIDVPLVNDSRPKSHILDPEKVVEVLLSLSS